MSEQSSKPIVSVVLGSYNRLPYLKVALESVRRETASIPHEIIVVDGGSTDGSVKYLTQQKDVITIVQHNRGTFRGEKIKRRSWGYFMNLAFKAAQGKYICMISDDCLFIPGALTNGVQLFEKELQSGRKIGSVAFYWRNWPEMHQYFVSIAYGTIFVNHGLYLRQALQDIGFADEDYYVFYSADLDICLRMMQAGFVCIDSPESYVEHHSHANAETRQSNESMLTQDKQRFMERWRWLAPELTDYDKIHYLQYRSFSDQTNTADLFRKIENAGLNAKIRRVRGISVRSFIKRLRERHKGEGQ